MNYFLVFIQTKNEVFRYKRPKKKKKKDLETA